MTVLLWNTGERQYSGLWSPLRTPIFFYNPRPQPVLLCQLGWSAAPLRPVFVFFSHNFCSWPLNKSPGIDDTRVKKKETTLAWTSSAMKHKTLHSGMSGLLLSSDPRVRFRGSNVREAGFFRFKSSDAFPGCREGINKLVSLVNSESQNPNL